MASRELQPAALAPITDALPELRASDYGDVVQLDAEIVAASAAFDAYTGQRLALIRDRLTTGRLMGSGLWTRYLKARGINIGTAEKRIAKAEGHPWSRQPLLPASSARLPEPEYQQIADGTSRRIQPDIVRGAVLFALRPDAGDLAVPDFTDGLSVEFERKQFDRDEMRTRLATLRGLGAVFTAVGSPDLWDGWADDDGDSHEMASGQIVDADPFDEELDPSDAGDEEPASWEALGQALDQAVGQIMTNGFHWPFRR